jgi:hypothetical protein
MIVTIRQPDRNRVLAKRRLLLPTGKVLRHIAPHKLMSDPSMAFKTLPASTLAVSLLATQAAAQDMSFAFEGAYGAWANRNGGAGITDNGGLNGTDTRAVSQLSFGVAREFTPRFAASAQIAYGHWSSAASDLDTDDATQSTLDATLRGFWQGNGPVRYSAFFGIGEQNDYGDSDQDMSYAFVGADAEWDTDFGSVFTQIGYFDSSDEFSEGTQNAPFIRVGGIYEFGLDYAATAAFSVAGGEKYVNKLDNRTLNIELGLEKDFGSFVGFARYEWTQISYKFGGDRFGDTFETLSLGVRLVLGGDVDHGPSIAPIGRWVAYNANEIE